jgi:hypothetical protein
MRSMGIKKSTVLESDPGPADRAGKAAGTRSVTGNTQPKKSFEDVRIGLRTLLGEMDVAILKEYDEKEHWGFWIQAGDFPVLIDNEKGLSYCMAVLQITFRDEAAVRNLNRFYEQQDAKFIFELTRILTSNRATFSRILEGGTAVGYSVTTYLYPFHPGFTIRELDRAIRAVVAAGDVGVAFLKLAIGQTVFDHTPAHPSSEPGPMFE